MAEATAEWSNDAKRLLELIDELPDAVMQLRAARKRVTEMRTRSAALYLLMSKDELVRLEPLVAEKISKFETL